MHNWALFALTLCIGVLVSCASRGERVIPSERGWASWYGPGFDGKRTANGEVYDMHALTAAHRSLPFGTLVEVYNRDNGLSVQVRINDRGPFARGRIIDLSQSAAKAIEMVGPGTARVELRIVPQPGKNLEPEFFVQVGAYSEKSNAENVLRELEPEFSNIEVISVGSIYRVRIGPFPNRRKANKRLRSVQKTHRQSFVVESSY